RLAVADIVDRWHRHSRDGWSLLSELSGARLPRFEFSARRYTSTLAGDKPKSAAAEAHYAQVGATGIGTPQGCYV
ncbi:hypothetical protein ACJH6J_30570, partial [Mycobacterium sp. SMC-18]|uniref:hypothetical protein n=1 Tax=Mycobacterium sp. SMC-18 TaxID=3381629 RepID=UPI003875D5DD